MQLRGCKSLTTLGAPGFATRGVDATRGAPGLTRLSRTALFAVVPCQVMLRQRPCSDDISVPLSVQERKEGRGGDTTCQVEARP